MNRLTNRALALLLVLALCISMLPGMAMAASVSYVTGTVMDKDNAEVVAENVIKNWGVRGQTATFLSPNAVAFYEKNSVTYDSLAAMTGSGDLETLADSDLYKALNALVVSNHATITSYDDTRTMYSYTDCQNSDITNLTCFYTGSALNPVWDSGATWSREHIFPQSKSVDDKREDDIIVLRPVDKSINSSRGNKAYGESDGFYKLSDIAVEDVDVRGDVARNYLYNLVRWGTELVYPNDEGSYKENTTTGVMTWGDLGVFESKEILVSWMTADPVDTWEMGRNDSVESITGTRNVFVDYPELAYTLLGEEIPADLTSPSGEGYVSTYTITATANDDTYGTVEVNGNKITAFPAENYEAVGCEVTAGTATVTQSGNVFTVEATADCTVQITFALKEVYTVTYWENGNETNSVAVNNGDKVTLPGATVTEDDYEFMGWVDAQLDPTTDAPAFLAAGSELEVTGNINLYALYSRYDSNAAGSSSSFELYSGAITAGDYLITYEGGAMKAAVSNSRLSYSNITATDGTVLSAADDLIWTIALTSDGYVTLYNASVGKYAASTGAKNKAQLLSSGTDAMSLWTVTGDSTYEFVNLQNTTNNVNKNLRKNGTYGFACYATGTGGALTLYKRVTGAYFYSTGTKACEHTNMTEVEAQAPTCTVAGFTAYSSCNDCGVRIGYEEIPATGHSYDAVVTPPTQTEQGYTTYTCANCGDSYVGDKTDALQWLQTISFCVPAGVEAVADITSTYNGFTMPAAGEVEGYTFEGWTTETVNNTTAVPTLYKAGSTHSRTNEPLTFYAVYSYSEGGSGEIAWQLVESVDQLAVNKKVVVAAVKYDFALSTTQNSNNRGAAAITKDAATKTITFGDDVAELTLGAGTADGTYSFYAEDNAGYLYAASSSNNYLRTQTSVDANASFKIAITDGVASVVAQGSNTRNTMRYNTNKLFATYASTSTMPDICLYVQTGDAGVKYYTSVFGCDHEYVDGLCCKCELVGDGESNYASIADALAETGSDYLYLNFDVTEDVVVDSDLILDLNGKTLTGDIEILDGASLQLFDTATADYTYENRGKVEGSITGNLVRAMNTPESYGHNYKYLTICEEDGSYSAHRIYLTVKSVALAPCIADGEGKGSAISYKTVFKCSELVTQYVESYGVQMTGDTTVTKDYGMTLAAGENWGTVRLDCTLSTNNTDEVNAANAIADVAVSARIVLTDGTELVSAAVTRSLQDLVVYANGVEDLTDLQKKALGKMYTLFSGVMESWEIPNIKSYAN